MISTIKKYYSDPYLYKTKSQVVQVFQSKSIELNQTIAYPEGGGQDSDQGIITHIKTGNQLAFKLVKRMFGHSIKTANDNWVNVDGVVFHFIEDNDLEKLELINAGDDVIIEIDYQHRHKLSTSHSASHLLYMGVGQIRPELINNTIGCHIKEGQARFDFRTDQKFSLDELTSIETLSNQLVKRDLDIVLFASDEHKDARFWQCDDQVIPCGGTHLEKTGSIGNMLIKRKNIGKGKERIICQLNNPLYDTHSYKEDL
jgi:Ser-tRNA(Ala) deacylase AlaX